MNETLSPKATPLSPPTKHQWNIYMNIFICKSEFQWDLAYCSMHCLGYQKNAKILKYVLYGQIQFWSRGSN